METKQLIEKFEHQSFEPGEFGHQEHLKVAWFYVTNESLPIAKQKFHQAIEKLVIKFAAEDKYHRTLTDFFLDYLQQIKWFLQTNEWDEVERNCPLLIQDAKKLVSYYYSQELLDSEHARCDFVEADIMLLDRASLILTDKPVPVYHCIERRSPVIVSMPHHGQFIPHDVLNTMLPSAIDSADTDWYLVQLYNCLDTLGITCINANYSRYLIDLNRDSSGAVLYANADNTELCPTSTFDLEPLYGKGMQPNAQEINRRVEHYWRPYHNKLEQLIATAKQEFGFAILFEAHSIQSKVPRFFSGRLPDFNLGTNDGKTVNHTLDQLLQDFNTGEFSKIINGRFKGGFITRHYADPDNHIFTIQLELSQATYLNEKHRLFDAKQARVVQQKLKTLLENVKETVINA